jgi:hypothetical protein
MASSYANLFMGSLEDFLKSEESKPDLWLRFIDDTLLCTHGRDSLLLFLDRLNRSYPVRFT